MKKLAIILFLLITTSAFADVTVIVDPSGWTQDQKIMTHAMAANVLDKNGITFTGIRVNLPNIEVLGNSASVGVLNTSSITSEYATWRAAQDIIDNAAIAEELEKQNTFNANELKDIKISQIDSRIDLINNLADMKVFLKKFVRYAVSKRS